MCPGRGTTADLPPFRTTTNRSEPNAEVRTLVEGLGRSLPIVTTEHNTYESARIASTPRGLISRGSQRKRDLALSAFERNVDGDAVLAALDVPRSSVVTPLMSRCVAP